MAKEPTKKKTVVKKPATSPARAPSAARRTVRTTVPALEPATGVLPSPPAPPAATPVKTAAKPASTAVVTTVVVKYDAGFGNSLFLRGEGAGLSWEKGQAMHNAAADEWIWVKDAVAAPFSVKAVLNDEVWADGPNVTVAPGEKKVIVPVF